MTSTTDKKIVSIVVNQHKRQGLLVKLEGNQEGIIRVREISWDERKLKNWRDEYPIGWRGNALVLPSKHKDFCELSLRFTKDDPWNLINNFDKDEIFEGVVTGVVDYGAFIEILPGLTGLFHRSEIPDWSKKEPMELFWPGDKVLVSIREVNKAQRKIKLTLPQDTPPENEPSSIIPDPPIIKREVKNDLEKLLEPDAPRKHILVVENEEAQATAIGGWLRKLNQRVDILRNAEEAIEFLENTQPDIALVDVGLDGMSGTELVAYILDEYPKIETINATDWAHANTIEKELGVLEARGANLLLKPLLPEDLLPFLLEDKRLRIPVKEGKLKEEITLLDIPEGDVKKRIRKLLLKCKEHLSFEQVILFSLEPAHRKVDVIEHIGSGLLNKKALSSLVYSPVRDVAEDKEVIVVNEIDEREEKRFRYLIEFCPSVTSCIGIPVSAQSSTDYALFLLGKATQEITNEEQIYVEGVALAIGTALTQRSLKEKFILMQRTALIGHLTRAMMHEINNLVGPLWNSASVLEKSLSECGENVASPDYGMIKEDVVEIQHDVRKIINTTKIFGRIVRKGKREILIVDEIIRETLSLLKDISDRAHVILEFKQPDKLIIVRSQAVVLEQIFLNVLLNAVQQIEELRSNLGGWVKISMKLVHNEEKGPMCRILVQDNGPGIHTSLWEKIFEIGFTTRTDGSGIGLYISRNLMDDIGGKIYVSKSHILGGTQFELEFPVSL